jgi:manganese efflux pump family protein
VLAFVGWLAGAPLAEQFGAFDHWIAFGLLAAIGGKTIVDALRAHDGAQRTPLGATKLALAALATSLDAWAAGFGLSLVGEAIAPTAFAAMLVTFVGSLAAYFAGGRLAARWERIGHVVAGLVLIAVGAHILYAHRAQWLGP